MKLVTLTLSLTILITLMIEAVAFHKATVCRQEAWRESLILKTRSLLDNSKPYDRSILLNCHVHITRTQDSIYWQRLPSLNRHDFLINLRGTL